MLKVLNNSELLGTGRNSNIDSLKGLCMLFVIIGHTDILISCPFIYRFIYTFHMPVFFVLSGMFIKSDLFSVGTIRRNAVAYLKPYYLSSAILLLLTYFVSELHVECRSVKDTLASVLLANYKGYFVGPIYFLWALFWGNTLFRFLLSRWKGLSLGLLVFMIFFFNRLALPLGVRCGLGSLPFIYIGYLLRNNYVQVHEFMLKWLNIILILGLWLFFALKFQIYAVNADYPFGLSSVVGSALFSILLVIYSPSINNKLFAFLGSHSLLILCTHTIVCTFLNGTLINELMGTSFLPDNYCLTLLEVIFNVLMAVAVSGLIVCCKGKIKFFVIKK